jgi:hypothetical protein
MVTLFRLARLINFIKGKMDGKELEEDLTWQDLLKVLEEKRKFKGNVDMKNKYESTRYAPGAMRSASFKKAKVEDEVKEIAWRDLLLMIFEERSFFSLKKDSGGKTSISKVESSRKVLDYFFEKAWEKPLLKSRPFIMW